MSKMKTFIATVQVEFTCVDEGMVIDRVMGVPFGDHDFGFRIKKVKRGKLAKGQDETLKPAYRKRHGLR